MRVALGGDRNVRAVVEHGDVVWPRLVWVAGDERVGAVRPHRVLEAERRETVGVAAHRERPADVGADNALLLVVVGVGDEVPPEQPQIGFGEKEDPPRPCRRLRPPPPRA